MTNPREIKQDLRMLSFEFIWWTYLVTHAFIPKNPTYNGTKTKDDKYFKMN